MNLSDFLWLILSKTQSSSMISVLSGTNLTLELSTSDLLEKNKFFSRQPPVKAPKYRFVPERTDIILLKWIQRDLISAATKKKTKLKL